MSLMSRLLASFSAPLSMPNVHALGGDSIYIGSLDDPRIGEYLRFGSPTLSGERVDEQVGLHNSTLFRASNLICSAMGMLPCQIFRRINDDEVEKARDHPLYPLFTKKPNSWQTPMEFKSFMQSNLLFHGVGHAMIVRGVNKRPMALVPLEGHRVRRKLGDDWVMRFWYRRKSGVEIAIPAEDMFWVQQPMSMDGVTPLKLIEVAAEAIGLARSAERAGANVFKKGAMIGGVLEHPKSLSPQAIENIRQQWDDRYSGAENAGKWVVAEEGMVAKPLGQTMREAQHTEFRKHQIEEVARFTGVPRPLLMMDETSWGTGIEALGLFFITYCLMPFFVSWEEAIARSLIPEAEQDKVFAKFNEGALLRGSLKDQAEFFAKALGSGGHGPWMTQDEVREKFNQNPMGGDAAKLPSGTQQKDPNAGGQGGTSSVPPKTGDDNEE